MLTLAIQKSGRLSEKTTQLLNRCGIDFENGGQAKLKAKAKNFPLEVLFLRDDDIPECVNDKIADAGIVGENVYLEKDKPLEIAEKLGFARCRLSLALPKNTAYHSLSDFNNLKIATSYPNILKKFLRKNKINAMIHEINGSVEIAPSIGLADAIFDVVGTGSTLLSNGLKEVETLVHSQAVLVKNRKIDKSKISTLEQLVFRIRSVMKARSYKYILLNAPNRSLNKIFTILPGMKSPTIMPLADKEWSSVHSVIHEDDFWVIIEQLKAAGAEGILVTPIEQMII